MIGEYIYSEDAEKGGRGREGEEGRERKGGKRRGREVRYNEKQKEVEIQ